MTKYEMISTREVAKRFNINHSTASTYLCRPEFKKFEIQRLAEKTKYYYVQSPKFIKLFGDFVEKKIKDAKYVKPKGILSEREQEVVNNYIELLSIKDVANKLFISEATVKTHLVNIREKLGVRCNEALIKKYYEKRYNALLSQNQSLQQELKGLNYGKIH